MNEGLNDWINTTWILSAHSRAERRDCETTFITSFSPSPVRFEFTERSSLHKSVVNVSFQHEESPVHTIRKNNNNNTNSWKALWTQNTGWEGHWARQSYVLQNRLKYHVYGETPGLTLQLPSSQRTHHYHKQGNHSNSLDSNAGYNTELGKATVFTRKYVQDTSSQSAEAKKSGRDEVGGNTWRRLEQRLGCFCTGTRRRTGSGQRKHRDYINTHTQAPGEGDQGGGLNHTSREGDLEREER